MASAVFSHFADKHPFAACALRLTKMLLAEVLRRVDTYHDNTGSRQVLQGASTNDMLDAPPITSEYTLSIRLSLTLAPVEEMFIHST